MKLRQSLLSVLVALVALPSIHFLSAADEPQTELGSHMEKIGGAFRAVRRQIADPAKNEDTLARLAVIRENAEAALKLVPAKKADIPAAEQEKFLADYQARMKEFIRIVGKAEAAVKAGDNDEAANLVGVMADTQKQGHKDFQKKKKKAG